MYEEREIRKELEEEEKKGEKRDLDYFVAGAQCFMSHTRCGSAGMVSG